MENTAERNPLKATAEWEETTTGREWKILIADYEAFVSNLNGTGVGYRASVGKFYMKGAVRRYNPLTTIAKDTLDAAMDWAEGVIVGHSNGKVTR